MYVYTTKKEKDIYNQYYPTMGKKRKCYEKKNSKRLCVLIYLSVDIFGQDDNDRHNLCITSSLSSIGL